MGQQLSQPMPRTTAKRNGGGGGLDMLKTKGGDFASPRAMPCQCSIGAPKRWREGLGLVGLWRRRPRESHGRASEARSAFGEPWQLAECRRGLGGPGAAGRKPEQHCGPAGDAWLAGEAPTWRWQPTKPSALGRPGVACAGPRGSRGWGRPVGNWTFLFFSMELTQDNFPFNFRLVHPPLLVSNSNTKSLYIRICCPDKQRVWSHLASINVVAGCPYLPVAYGSCSRLVVIA
jgi:hypothetical protein